MVEDSALQVSGDFGELRECGLEVFDNGDRGSGRRALRSGLYMAAFAAARYNPILSSFYQRLRAKGKPHQLALTAVMRKLLLALNHTLKSVPCTT